MTARVDLVNTILSVVVPGENIFNNGGAIITSHGYNLSSDNGSGYLNGPGDQIDTHPMLGPLQNNGGPEPSLMHCCRGAQRSILAIRVLRHRLSTTNAARNSSRVRNGRIDIGSFEVQSGSTPTLINALHREMYTHAETPVDSTSSPVERFCDHFHAEPRLRIAWTSGKSVESCLTSSDALGHRLHS